LVGKGNGATENFDGAVDEVMIFNTALSQKDVQDTMNASASVQPAGKLGVAWGRLKKQANF